MVQYWSCELLTTKSIAAVLAFTLFVSYCMVIVLKGGVLPGYEFPHEVHRVTNDSLRSVHKPFMRLFPEQPEVLAVYFPQFHEDALNNALWGKGFTDWNNLARFEANRNGVKLVTPDASVTWYDLMDKDVREKQAVLAKKYGIDGFVYHHYWFYQPGKDAPDLARPLMQMLEDGEPDMPFAFNWANEDWTTTWNGDIKPLIKNKDGLLQKQFYPSPNDPAVEIHFQYLRKFFEHPNYIRREGKPVLYIYHLPFEEKLSEKTKSLLLVLEKLKSLAVEHGLGGLYLLHAKARGPLYWSDENDGFIRNFRRYFPYLDIFDATQWYPWPEDKVEKSFPSFERCHTPLFQPFERPWFVSAITAFDNTPRRSLETAHILPRNNDTVGYATDLYTGLKYAMECQQPNHLPPPKHLYLINAWNEWAEGMVLEPSDQFGLRFLEETLRIRQKIQAEFRSRQEE